MILDLGWIYSFLRRVSISNLAAVAVVAVVAVVAAAVVAAAEFAASTPADRHAAAATADRHTEWGEERVLTRREIRDTLVERTELADVGIGTAMVILHRDQTSGRNESDVAAADAGSVLRSRPRRETKNRP